MNTILPSNETTLIAGGVVFALCLVYYAALPRPLPGIPFNKHASSSLLGDVPEMIRYAKSGNPIFAWFTSQTTRHQSPIVQVFIRPLSLPWVVVTDPLESQDILLRRAKVFDRSHFFGDLIGGILPEQQNSLQSSDVRFKHNRSLVNHLISPGFISRVSGPEVYKSICSLMKIWELKCDIAKGRPFAADDITYGAFDSVLALSFGLPDAESIILKRLEVLTSSTYEINEDNIDKILAFPDSKVPEVFEAVLGLANSVNTQASPVPRLTSWIFNKFPYTRRVMAIKNQFIRQKIDIAVQRIENGETQEAYSALHSVLLCERGIAAKESRPPAYHQRAIYDEFFGFMLASYDTSATAAAWGVRLLTDHPAAQDRLRTELRSAMSQAARESRNPTYQELVNAHIPYLDAVVDEILRHANTVAFIVREACKDTTVLGCHIPKGTNILLMANGPGYLEPNLPLGATSRSPGARHQSGKNGLTGIWDDSDIRAFRPERWLVTNSKTGQESYDPMAGPSLSFGLGPRACFGRKLALLALRIQFALTVWNFYLVQTPPDLSGNDSIQRFSTQPTQCYVRLRSAIIKAQK